MRAGMRITHYDRVSRPHEPQFRKQRMAHAVTPDVEEVADMVPAGPFTEDFSLGRGLGVFRRRYMVYDGLYPVRIKNPVLALRHKVQYRCRSCNLVAENRVECKNMNIFSGAVYPVCVKYLFSYSISHSSNTLDLN